MFKLNIECTKDISELHINFTDGTSAVVENTSPMSPMSKAKSEKAEKSRKNLIQKPKDDENFNVDPRESLYDYDENVPEVSKEVVKLPEIPEPHRDVKVAKELHNLEF